MAESSNQYGLLAQYDTPADLMSAAEQVRDAGYRKWDVYTPFPVHGMDDAMGIPNSKVGYFTFFGGLTGFTAGMLMIWFMNSFDYAIVVGGKPFFSPIYAFPVSYEMTILLGAFGTLFGMAFLNRLPKLYNPLLKHASFKAASDDKFFLCIECADAKFSEAETSKLLKSTGPQAIESVEE